MLKHYKFLPTENPIQSNNVVCLQFKQSMDEMAEESAMEEWKRWLKNRLWRRWPWLEQRRTAASKQTTTAKKPQADTITKFRQILLYKERKEERTNIK